MNLVLVQDPFDDTSNLFVARTTASAGVNSSLLSEGAHLILEPCVVLPARAFSLRPRLSNDSPTTANVSGGGGGGGIFYPNYGIRNTSDLRRRRRVNFTATTTNQDRHSQDRYSSSSGRTTTDTSNAATSSSEKKESEFFPLTKWCKNSSSSSRAFGLTPKGFSTMGGKHAVLEPFTLALRYDTTVTALKQKLGQAFISSSPSSSSTSLMQLSSGDGDGSGCCWGEGWANEGAQSSCDNATDDNGTGCLLKLPPPPLGSLVVKLETVVFNATADTVTGRVQVRL